MSLHRRRHFLASLPAFLAGTLLSPPAAPAEPAPGGTGSVAYRGRLPWRTVFVGEDRFDKLCHQAEKGNWAALPIGQRTATVAQALLGTRYGSFTLEIDDHIEAASANLHALDCWTFYEVSLAFARMIHSHPAPWAAPELLKFIELERYRDGRCTGEYLSRMHHLEEVFANNERRSLGRNLTRSLGGVPVHRNIHEMQIAWHSYRYLRCNPSCRGGMAQLEGRVSHLPVTYIPKAEVAHIESQLQSGDVLAIASKDESAYTSHVGLALREGPICRFMHATSSRDKGRRCIIDKRISQYLADKHQDLGLIVFRPSEA
jgi:hypothetical protein